MSTLSRLVMVRHGETEGESSIRFYGATNVALSETGRGQVRAAAKWLPRAAIDAWVSSSLSRAWESARILAKGRPIRLDADFHMAIIEASHNVIMLHMMRSMFQLLREGVFYNRQIMFAQKTTRAALLDQHRAINDAIQARDPDATRTAVQAHLDYVKSALAAEQKSAKNEAVAKLRFQHEKSR